MLERDDLLGFQDLLSAKLQRRKHDQHELLQMFATWRAHLLPYAQALRNADWTLIAIAARASAESQVAIAPSRSVVRFRPVGGDPQPLIRVVEECGALRIDEN